MLTDPALQHVSFDISWDEVAKYAVRLAAGDRARRGDAQRYPDRFLFGTDTVAPAGPAPYYAVFDMWAPVWRLLTPDASLKVRKGNYERIFDEGRRRVRAWEKANVPYEHQVTERTHGHIEEDEQWHDSHGSRSRAGAARGRGIDADAQAQPDSSRR